MKTQIALIRNWKLQLGSIAAASVIAATTATVAEASNCVDQVNRIADAHNLTIALPEAGAPVEPGDLAHSQGVIAPPETGDPAVIEPPETPGSRMPTTPDLSGNAETDTGAGVLSSADRLLLEGILISARAEAESGDIERCFERLRKARSLIAERTG